MRSPPKNKKNKKLLTNKKINVIINYKIKQNNNLKKERGIDYGKEND